MTVEPRKRLFIGIPYPPAASVLRLLDELRDLGADPASGLRPILPDNLHITLNFLGSVPVADIATLCQLMDHCLASTPGFSLRLAGFGCFRQALWLGVEPSEPLERLASDLVKELHRSGFPGDDKPYRPHLTVARLGKSARLRLSDLQSTYANRHWGGFDVQAVHLFESQTLPEGARYTSLHVTSLN